MDFDTTTGYGYAMALVLDCSILLPGPMMGKILAQMGHQVLKLENPDRPDPARKFGSGTYYDDLNGLKTLVPMDLQNPKDRPDFEALVKKADGLIEGYRPETKAKLGLLSETLHKINPRLTILSIVGFPKDHPRHSFGAHDINFQAVSGLLSLQAPHLPAIPLADLLAAYQGALGFTHSLLEPDRKNVYLEISIYEVLKNSQSKLMAEFEKTGIVPSYGSTLTTGLYPCYGLYQTKDGRHLAVGAIEERYWTSFCNLIGKPHLLGQGLTTGDSGAKVRAEIADAISKKTHAEWKTLLKEVDACVDPVLNYSEIVHGVF